MRRGGVKIISVYIDVRLRETGWLPNSYSHLNIKYYLYPVKGTQDQVIKALLGYLEYEMTKTTDPNTKKRCRAMISIIQQWLNFVP